MVTRHLLAQAVAQQFFGCFISMNYWFLISHFCNLLLYAEKRLYFVKCVFTSENVEWLLCFVYLVTHICYTYLQL